MHSDFHTHISDLPWSEYLYFYRHGVHSFSNKSVGPLIALKFFLTFIVNQQVKRIDKTNRKYGKCSYFIGRESSGAEGFSVPPQLLVCNHTHQFCMQETHTQSLCVIVSIQNTT